VQRERARLRYRRALGRESLGNLCVCRSRLELAI
jgi:hypothetical protein